MSATPWKRLEAIRQKNADPGWVNRDVYRLLYKKELYIPGRMASETVPSDMIDKIISEMRDESFRFGPMEKIYIPKPDGTKIISEVQSVRDRTVRKVMADILEAVYDSPKGPYFRDCSHGLRPRVSAHTALREYRKGWSDVNWIIKDRIESLFEQINPDILCEILKQKIADDRFIKLIRKSLKRGYRSRQHRFRKSPIETFSPGKETCILRALLSNIYLNEFDNYVMDIGKQVASGEWRVASGEWTRTQNPEPRTQNPEPRTRNPEPGTQNPEPGTQNPEPRTQNPEPRTQNPEPRTQSQEIKYLRYADEWIIGIKGPKYLASDILNKCRAFLTGNLGLTLSESPEMTHAKTEDIEFLGTLLGIKQERKHGHKTGHNIRWQASLKIPIQTLVRKLKAEGFCDGSGYPVTNTACIWKDDAEIVAYFGYINRSLSDYYRFADNFREMAGIEYILRYSCAKTLAAKHKMSVPGVFRKYTKKLTVRYEADGEIREQRFWRNTSYKKKQYAFMSRKTPPELTDWKKQHGLI